MLRLVLRAAATMLPWASVPFLVVGWLASPILWTARWCDECARGWDQRLWARGGHTDLHPPPGA